MAATDLFAARWSDQIHDEWIRNVLAQRSDISRSQLERTRDLMNDAIPDCIVRGHEPLIHSLELPDPDDRHVLAAAIVAHAQMIVTFNLRDFPVAALGAFGIEAIHPDRFIECPTQHRLSEVHGGTNIPSLSKKVLLQVTVPVPPIKVQQAVLDLQVLRDKERQLN